MTEKCVLHSASHPPSGFWLGMSGQWLGMSGQWLGHIMYHYVSNLYWEHFAESANVSLRYLVLKWCAHPLCVCAGVKPVKGEWSEEELTWFESLVLENSFFVVEVDRMKGTAIVALLDTSQSETVDVTDAMKKAFPPLSRDDWPADNKNYKWLLFGHFFFFFFNYFMFELDWMKLLQWLLWYPSCSGTCDVDYWKWLILLD